MKASNPISKVVMALSAAVLSWALVAETSPKEATPKDPNARAERHEQMAEMHRKMAECLRSGKAPTECRDDSFKDFPGSAEYCPFHKGMRGTQRRGR